MAKPGWWLNWKLWAGVIAVAGATAVFFLLNPGTPRLALFWLFGLTFGFIVQRSRFCFVSALGNLFTFRDGRLLKGILGGLFLATIGFAFIMYRQVPDPASGMIPSTAYVAPFGWHLVLAGLLFGLGMMLAGGCILGNLYRMSEGAISSVIALLGVLAGMGLLQHNWPWWWQSYISHLPAVWLPASLGWIGAIAITLVVIALLFWLIVRTETHNASNAQPVKTEEPISLRFVLAKWSKSFFISARPLALGGVILALVNVIEYQVVERPWGIMGEVMRWAQVLLDAIHLPPPPLATVPGT